MQLEEVTAELRPRGSWEAIDMGFALTRTHFRLLITSWLLTVVPLWALLLAASHWVPMGLVLLIIWWLKPIYDRVPLFILSRILFGAKPRVRDVLKAWPGMLWKRAFALLFKRVPWLIVLPQFSWGRSLLLPLVDLENQRGRGYAERRKVLLQFAGGAATALVFLCSLYEFILIFALLTLGSQFSPVPQGAMELGDAFIDAAFRRGEIAPWLEWSLVGGYLTALTLVELFYVGGGFGLYLNCRTTLEGWDVELTFRRLARRIGTAAIFVALALIPLNASAKNVAQEKNLLVTPAKEVPLEKSTLGKKPEAEAIERVLKDADFTVHKVKTSRWVPEEGDIKGDFSAFSWFKVLGEILYWLLIIAVVALLVWLIWKNRHIFNRTALAAADAKPAAPRTLMGLDLTPDSLPADIVAAARERWLAGNPRGALSLLYRGSLSWLVHTAQLSVRESDTENDCLRHCNGLPEPTKREYFSLLTGQWVRTAYAELDPPSAAMERLLESWPFNNQGNPERRSA